jgi:hypothetical protein
MFMNISTVQKAVIMVTSKILNFKVFNYADQHFEKNLD